MKKRLLYPIVLAIIGILALVAACSPYDLLEPTPPPTPTGVAAQDTPTPTASPSPTATLPASPTPTGSPQPTATPTTVPPTATPTLTPSAVPPTATFTPLPPTATPQPTATPTPVTITDWRGEYYDNPSLQPPPVVVRNDRVVDLDLAPGTPPAAGMPSESWSARWSRTWTFDEGNYRFHVLVDDGARLWIDGQLVIDAWSEGPPREFTQDLYLRGQAHIQLDYYNHLGGARARLNWERVTQFEGWQGSYYATRDLSGLPVFQRGDADINFNWGTGAPRADLPADNFSVRWTRRVNFERAGTYRFVAQADDGVRLWVDGTRIMDAWSDGRGTHEAQANVPAGNHDLRVEFYEHLGEAMIQVRWDYVTQPTPAPTATDTPIPPTPAPPTPSPPPGADILIEPTAGPLGQPFTVMGRGWPANAPVDLFLKRPLPRPRPLQPVAQPQADAAGRFVVQLTAPEDGGWEGLPSVIVVARSASTSFETEAAYRILPPLTQVSFSPIPWPEAQMAAPQPVFLVLDSQAAWSEWFGSAPAPVDWQQEIVIGVHLGPGRTADELDISSLVYRNETVSIWLSLALDQQSGRREDRVVSSHVLVRVPRSELPPAGRDREAQRTFVFLDASGRVLAQGPAGRVEPRRITPFSEAAPAEEERSLEAAPPPEAEAETGTALSDQPGVAVVEATEPPAEAPTEEAAEVEEEAVEVEKEATEGQPTMLPTATPQVEQARPVRNVVGVIVTIAGLVLLVLIVGLVLVGLFVRQRRRSGPR